MSYKRLRDRDAILTKEKLIFRVYGYSHPPNAYICDVEYAPEEIFKSKDPRAIRDEDGHFYYKFYEDEGLRFVERNYPKYMVYYKPLNRRLVGVPQKSILEVRKPDEAFKKLIRKDDKDELLKALSKVFNIISSISELKEENFGVFGSLLHGFYHPKFSDIDLIIYGSKALRKLHETLEELYKEKNSTLRNEFESLESLKGKRWRFVNYTPKEFIWHQRRKMIYALFRDREIKRLVKVEFEPVKDWKEIKNEYNSSLQIENVGWIKALAKVADDKEAPFMPSIYGIELIKILDGPKVESVRRIISYVEEFRMQVKRDERIYVEGNLELVRTSKQSFYQITLTRCPRYYEQVLKCLH